MINLNDNPPEFVQNGEPVLEVDVNVTEEMNVGSLVYTFEVRMLQFVITPLQIDT